MDPREENVYMAKLAEQAESYPEMLEAIKKVAQLGLELTVDERNLFSIAYKNILRSTRGAWRTLSTIEEKDLNQNQAETAKKYREKIEAELTDLCNDVLEVLDFYLIPSTNIPETKIFLLKMKGDYSRYMAEFSVGDVRQEAGNKALYSYKQAIDLSSTNNIPSTNPTRLGLVLNFSIFCYEILNFQDEAYSFAKKAFDDAISGLDLLSSETYKEAMLVLNFIRDNLVLWGSDKDEDDADKDYVDD